MMSLNQHDEEKNMLKILTYNIILRPPLINTNSDDCKDQRMEHFMKIMDEFDVICLQEIFGSFNTRKQGLIFKSQKQGYLYHAASPDPPFCSFKVAEGGLLTLSKYPIVYTEFEAYRKGAMCDQYSYKGVLYTKIKVGECHLHVFNTHLQSTYVSE